MKILLTRPQGRNERLSALLSSADIKTYIAPLLSICNHTATTPDFQRYQKIIFISKNSVEFAYNIYRFPKDLQYFSVGKSTAEALAKIGIKATTPATQSTEGLLALDQLKDVQAEQILIVRGVGGREALKQQLQRLGAQVDYWEVYQRQPNRDNTTATISHWQQQEIDHILITSGESLLTLIDLVQDKDKLWLLNCTLVVVSERIATIAKQAGFNRILLSASANDDDILATLTQGI